MAKDNKEWYFLSCYYEPGTIQGRSFMHTWSAQSPCEVSILSIYCYVTNHPGTQHLKNSNKHLLHSFWWSGIWEGFSWVALVQGVSLGCSLIWRSDWGWRTLFQGVSFMWLASCHWLLVVPCHADLSPQGCLSIFMTCRLASPRLIAPGQSKQCHTSSLQQYPAGCVSQSYSLSVGAM